MFLTDSVAHKSSRFVMCDAVEPNSERSRQLKRFQSAKRVEPDLLVKIKRIVSVWDEAPQVIKQRPFVAIEKANECVSVTRLGFRNPKRLFESGEPVAPGSIVSLWCPEAEQRFNLSAMPPC